MLRFQLLQASQVGHQCLHAPDAVLLEILGIHQRARNAGHILVAEQQAQVRALAKRVGGAQQVGDGCALTVQRLPEFRALLLQLIELLLLGSQLRVRVAHGTGRTGQGIGLFGQVGIGAVTACGRLRLLPGQRLHLAAQVRQLLFCLRLLGLAAGILPGIDGGRGPKACECGGEQATGDGAGGASESGHAGIITESGESREDFTRRPRRASRDDRWIVEATRCSD